MSIDIVEQRITELMASKRPIEASVKFQFKDGGVLRADWFEDQSEVLHDDGLADCTIKIKSADLLKMMDGKMDPMLAYTMGKLSIKGDMGIAMKLTKMFG